MKLGHQKLALSTLLATSLFAFGTAASYANDGEKCDGHYNHKTEFNNHSEHGPFSGRGGPSFAGHDMHNLRKLDLTAEQKDQVKQIFEKQKPLRDEKFQALRDSSKALREANQGATYDSKKVQELANQQAVIQADLIVLHSETKHQIYALLTPEQKQKWDDRARRQGAPKQEHSRG
ncbi:hypothetical protein A7981_01550 [Methylovorus sp. MM2]|uniref:Spy/CpxP family protein refolding chaperone n=1 Tax=Methylovorus sp. MM2 TaxID=1848038 RepID=UPI0007DEE8E5|nr:Spy/CpxP family protein refolding chaperone [Methylovorus sp. MM2]OAM52201.1 hypothetical protein A7981_01550 [Methylovorus sp. MM2]